mmetsp:Transcript_39748/g.93341  ORF Transcript_39748/g.93341 Transcript_39748/m.93341 type:complete len:110 (-) Transcript_39748:383-712(-)
MPRTEFRSQLQQGILSRQADNLFMVDPTGMSFYTSGEQELRAVLKAVVASYEVVVFLGNCMGATGALLCADLLSHKKTTVLAFNPEVDPFVDPRLGFKTGAWLQREVCH